MSYELQVKDVKTHKDLLVWQKSMDFVVDIYAITKSFPNSELFALTNQIRRCVTSIPANIAEGLGRKGNKEFIHFLHVALGSATELETFLIIAQRLNYIDDHIFEKLDASLTEIIRMTIGLIKSINNK
ncbi:MAG: four helix bundle protein [Prevotellaceae bacterium]|jgi:four helix bundle protein|nr:four helix bundle protein [Prevotellaceae bacterium]